MTDEESMSDAEWAARLLSSARRPVPLSSAELQAIGERLRRPRSVARPRLVWRLAVVAILLLCGGALTAGTARLLRLPPFAETDPAPATQTPPAPRPLRRTRAPEPAPLAPPEPPQLEPELAVRPRRAPASPAPAPVDGETTTTTPAVGAPSALREEARLLASALRRLREEDDPAGALALLDEHTRRFGDAGPLADEARTTRIEAWLRSGDRGSALAALDTLMLRPWGRARALRAARADLRAEAGRCAEALTDFEALLASDAAAGDAIAERALFGRASCLARQGDADAARADLERYLARFPGGANAERARAALAR
jgi:hypothetical protein